MRFYIQLNNHRDDIWELFPLQYNLNVIIIKDYNIVLVVSVYVVLKPIIMISQSTKI